MTQALIHFVVCFSLHVSPRQHFSRVYSLFILAQSTCKCNIQSEWHRTRNPCSSRNKAVSTGQPRRMHRALGAGAAGGRVSAGWPERRGDLCQVSLQELSVSFLEKLWVRGQRACSFGPPRPGGWPQAEGGCHWAPAERWPCRSSSRGRKAAGVLGSVVGSALCGSCVFRYAVLSSL